MDLTDFVPDEQEALSVDARKGAHANRTASFLPGRDEVGDDIHWGDTGAIDHVLQGRQIEGSATTAIRALTDRAKKADSLKLPVSAGTRVAFQHNLGSVLHYANVPDDEGTVVTVRSANGDITSHDGLVMVAWDDGQFLPVMPEHLHLASEQPATNGFRMRAASFGDLSSFFESPRFGSNDLVHKATKDLWSMTEGEDGFVIERLFSESGDPLKV